MQPALLLAINNWRAKPGRTLGTLIAIALGVGTVVWVTSSYASVQNSISDQVVERWVGKSHLSIEPPLGHWGHMPDEVADILRSREEVAEVTSRLKRRMNLVIEASMARPTSDDLIVLRDRMVVDAIGIDPKTEYTFRQFKIEGRLLTEQDSAAALFDAKTARDLGVWIGDTITLERYEGGLTTPLEIVGIYHGQRAAKFQKPMIFLPLKTLQQATNEPSRITIADAILRSPDPAIIEALATDLRNEFRERRWGHQVTTATARLNQLAQAQEQTEFALILASSVALLTAFFIIVSTLNMGLVERVTYMGTLRCLGMTRLQIVGIVLGDIAPIGLAGSLLGVPIGLALTHAGTWVAPEYISEIVLSTKGIVIAVVGGLLTTLAAAMLPAMHASSISPLAAIRAMAKPAGRKLPYLSAMLGLILILIHVWMTRDVAPEVWIRPGITLIGVGCLYIGYALLTPLAVRLVGFVAVQIVARLIFIKPILLHDQISRVAWRGAGICCGLMVGLSMMISVVVQSESVRAGWDFPKRLAEAFIWTRTPVDRETANRVRHLPGIGECTVIFDFLCDVGEQKKGLFKVFNAKSTFVAGEPDVFLKMAKLEFLEGNYDDAYAKLRSGGYILLASEASRAFGVHLGDTIKISAKNQSGMFEVAGIVQSPALDIAVTYFQADSYMMVAAAGSVLGTLGDAKRVFGTDAISMFLMNFALPEIPPPAIFATETPPPCGLDNIAESLVEWGSQLVLQREDVADVLSAVAVWDRSTPMQQYLRGLLSPYVQSMKKTADAWDGATPVQRWDIFRDELLMRQVARHLDRPAAIFGSLRRLKQQIDDDIREATILLATIPIIALLVAGVGVGNLMMTNVLSRAREIGVLRSVGATRGQIMRLVFGEALVLGVIGASFGVALGVHAAYSMIVLMERSVGFAPKFQLPLYGLAAGVGITIGICVIAGISPARFASRENVIATMRSV